jgi:hypothetical protein
LKPEISLDSHRHYARFQLSLSKCILFQRIVEFFFYCAMPVNLVGRYDNSSS